MGSQRTKIKAPVKLELWVRAGGRCQICNRYLMEGQLSSREYTFGEMAHIVGQKASASSPRGLDEGLDSDKRDSADNLILVCDDEHDELDKAVSRGDFSVAFLRELKRRHEERIELATSFTDQDRTTPLRLIGTLRGLSLEISRAAVAAAVMQSGRFPRFNFSTRHSIEISLVDIPGEDGPTAAYWRVPGE